MEFEIVNGIIDAPYFGIIYGAGGTGKSFMASYSDDPLFLPVEPGTDLIPAKKINAVCTSIDMLYEMMRFAMKADCKTVVIDSAGFIEPLIYVDIIKNTKPDKDGSKPESISDFGFGRGYAKAMDYWNRILAGITAIQKSGKNVILITHSHYKNIPLENGETFKFIDMALQTFGDYNVPELLKRRADWIYYIESKSQTRATKNAFGAKQNIAMSSAPLTTVYTRATSQFFAKVRIADESSIPDYYDLERHHLAEQSKAIFNDLQQRGNKK